MNCDKYYKMEKDGVYNVHFLNTNGYSVEQIKKLFSPYGKVFGVNTCGNDYGLRFVKYRSLDETIRCIQSLKNSKLIQLLPEKSKINNIDKTLEKTNSNQRQESKELAAKKEHSINVSKQFTSHFNNADSKVNHKLTGNLETSDQENRSDKADLNISSQDNNKTMHQNKWWTKDSSNSEKSYLSDSSKQLSPSFSEPQNFMDKNSSDAAINLTKYYRPTKDACYTLHFLNKNCLTSDAIKELFSPYGNVLNVYNNDNGFTFVKYKTVAEIENCLKNLLGDNIINILPQKDKVNGTTKRTDQNSKESSTVKTQINSNFSYNETSSTEYLSHFNVKSNPGNRFERNKADISSNKNPRNVKHASNNVNVPNDDKSIPISSEKYESAKKEDFINDKLVYDQGQWNTCRQEHLDSSTDFDSNVETNFYDSKIPDFISDTEEIKEKKSYSIAEKSFAKSKVIVANIHDDCSIYYILYLFEKYNPIAFDPVETIPETNIRYCKVYFKTVQDAAAVEKEFDDFLLVGKRLMVLQKPHLIEKAAEISA